MTDLNSPLLVVSEILYATYMLEKAMVLKELALSSMLLSYPRWICMYIVQAFNLDQLVLTYNQTR